MLPTPHPHSFAAIDIGSNSFRLELGRLRDGRYNRMDYLKEAVRLGAGLGPEGQLSEEAIRRGLACLARFRDRIDQVPGIHVRVVATQTLREATNRESFIQRAEHVLGHPIELIGGREEARLIYLGVSRLQPSRRPRLVIDIGGRSTELILGRGSQTLAMESFPVGCIGLSQRFFPDGRYTAAAFRAAQISTAAAFSSGFGTFTATQWQEALGSSGTAASIADILLANRITNGTITPEGLRWAITACLEAGRLDRLTLAGLEGSRKSILASGLAILYTLVMHLGIEALLPARGALRQGVVFDLEERLRSRNGPSPGQQDLRDQTVADLQRRFQVDLRQARRVSQVATDLMRRIRPQSELTQLRQLGWAAALHEIGRTLSHQEPHVHGAYLVEHADAPGFSLGEQQQLAWLIGHYQGALPAQRPRLGTDESIRKLLCLRLAALICQGRDAGLADQIHIDAGRRQVMFELRPQDPQSSAALRLRYLLEEETRAWARASGLRMQLVLNVSPIQPDPTGVRDLST